MKINHTVASTIILGLISGELKYPHSITSGNRLHTGRAAPGSREAAERIAAASLRRQRRAAKRRTDSGDLKP